MRGWGRVAGLSGLGLSVAVWSLVAVGFESACMFCPGICSPISWMRFVTVLCWLPGDLIVSQRLSNKWVN